MRKKAYEIQMSVLSFKQFKGSFGVLSSHLSMINMRVQLRKSSCKNVEVKFLQSLNFLASTSKACNYTLVTTHF